MFQLGSISEGTLRPIDLLQAFSSTLDDLSPGHTLVGQTTCYLDLDDEDDVDAATYLLDELQDALQELCPPYVFFGTNPGDGADFGFWPDMDALEDDMRGVEPNADGSHTFYGIRVVTSDHGNIEVYDLAGNSLWSVV